MKTGKIININCNAVEMQEDEALSRALQVVNYHAVIEKKKTLGFGYGGNGCSPEIRYTRSFKRRSYVWKAQCL